MIHNNFLEEEEEVKMMQTKSIKLLSLSDLNLWQKKILMYL